METTIPPCAACHAHEPLEKSMLKMVDQNKSEHLEILKRLDQSINDVNWMKTISKVILVTMITSALGSFWFIVKGTATENRRIDKMAADVKTGELHSYKNENNIAEIKGTLDFIKKEILKGR